MSIIKTSEVTKEVIQGWKEKHPSIYCYKSSDGKVLYLRTPTRNEIEAAQALSKSPVKSNEVLAKACALGGDEEILTEDKYFFGLSAHLAKIIVSVEGELTEL